MAVVRIHFPDRGAAESAATALEALPERADGGFLMTPIKRAVKEIRRVKERPGLTAELTTSEMERLGEVVENVVPRCRALIREKVEEARRLAEFDAAELLRRRETVRRVSRQVQGKDDAA